MKSTTMKIFALLVGNILCIDGVLANDSVLLSGPKVTIQAMAEGEIQPELFHDKQGRVHLVYFKVEDIKTRMGHLFYKQYMHETKSWTEAIQISQTSYRQPDVIATANLAVDGQGRVHVTWLSQNPAAYLYSRSDSKVKGFSAARSLVTQYIEGAEASAVISADQNTVSVTWMAGWDESLRTVYTMTSNDNGETFGVETMIGDQGLGGCGCCGYASDYNKQGELLVAYRSATNGNGRNMQLLSLVGEQKNTQMIDEWTYSSCPVSTNDLFHDNHGTGWAIWETAGRIYAAQVNDKVIVPFLVKDPKHDIRQKHPSMAVNNTQHRLIAWSEGDGYFSGGELNLQIFNPEFKTLDSPSTKGMRPAQFSRVAVSALADDSFLVLY